MPPAQCYLRSHTWYQLVSCSRGVVLSSSTSSHPDTPLPDHLLRQCSTSQARTHKGICSSPNFLFSSFQCFPVTCSIGIVSVAVSAAPGFAVKWEFYLWGFCIKVCMKTLRPPEVLLEKQEEEKHTPEWIFNSWRVRSLEMRPGGSSCDSVCFWGAPWTWTSDSWVKDAVNGLVESVLNLFFFFGIKIKIIITKCERVSDHWRHH